MIWLLFGGCQHYVIKKKNLLMKKARLGGMEPRRGDVYLSLGQYSSTWCVAFTLEDEAASSGGPADWRLGGESPGASRVGGGKGGSSSQRGTC